MEEHPLFFIAIHQLQIDVPILRYEIVAADGGNSEAIRLYLYGGRVVEWSPEQKPPAGRQIKRSRRGATKRTSEPSNEAATQ